jgi:hypothetical protein
MDTADRTQSEVAEPKAARLKYKIEKLKQQIRGLKEMEQRLATTSRLRSPSKVLTLGWRAIKLPVAQAVTAA